MPNAPRPSQDGQGQVGHLPRAPMPNVTSHRVDSVIRPVFSVAGRSRPATASTEPARAASHPTGPERSGGGAKRLDSPGAEATRRLPYPHDSRRSRFYWWAALGSNQHTLAGGASRSAATHVEEPRIAWLDAPHDGMVPPAVSASRSGPRGDPTPWVRTRPLSYAANAEGGWTRPSVRESSPLSWTSEGYGATRPRSTRRPGAAAKVKKTSVSADSVLTQRFWRTSQMPD